MPFLVMVGPSLWEFYKEWKQGMKEWKERREELGVLFLIGALLAFCYVAWFHMSIPRRDFFLSALVGLPLLVLYGLGLWYTPKEIRKNYRRQREREKTGETEWEQSERERIEELRRTWQQSGYCPYDQK